MLCSLGTSIWSSQFQGETGLIKGYKGTEEGAVISLKSLED